MDQEYFRMFNELKLPLKAEPFICQEDVDAAFECLEVAANPNIILIAKIAYNTGAPLNDILNIQSPNFYCTNTGRTFEMPISELYNLKSENNYYFSSKDTPFSHSYISSSFTSCSKCFGFNLSFLRFYRTFYYKRFLEEKTVEGIPLYIGMRDSKIRDNIGVSLELFNHIKCLDITWDYSVEKPYVFVIGRSAAAEQTLNRIYSDILTKYRHLVLIDMIEDSQTRAKFKKYRKNHVSYESFRFDLLDIFDRFLPTPRSGAILFYDQSISIDLPGYSNIERIPLPLSDLSYNWNNLLDPNIKKNP